MAHQISIRSNGFAEMAYVGELPWHGLGQPLSKGAKIEEWQTAAGMDFTICRAPVEFEYNGEMMQFPDREALFRCDNAMPLGIVSPQYKIVQPGHVLEFFRDLTESAGFTLETAGVLFGGKKYWALANIGENAMIVNGDVVTGYLMMTTSADGTSSTIVQQTTVRVVCANTLGMALSNKGKKRVTVSHRNNFNASKVKDQLGIARGEFAKWAEAMRQLSAVKVTQKDAPAIVFDILSAKPEAEMETEAADKIKGSRAYTNILRLFDGAGKGSQLDGVAGTAWGLLNAVTEQVDHFAHAHTEDARRNNAWFGEGDDLKTRAVEKLIAMA
jgi:phage/plasmid-like protein (TIGR03299 family)